MGKTLAHSDFAALAIELESLHEGALAHDLSEYRKYSNYYI